MSAPAGGFLYTSAGRPIHELARGLRAMFPYAAVSGGPTAALRPFVAHLNDQWVEFAGFGTEWAYFGPLVGLAQFDVVVVNSPAFHTAWQRFLAIYGTEAATQAHRVAYERLGLLP